MPPLRAAVELQDDIRNHLAASHRPLSSGPSGNPAREDAADADKRPSLMHLLSRVDRLSKLALDLRILAKAAEHAEGKDIPEVSIPPDLELWVMLNMTDPTDQDTHQQRRVEPGPSPEA